jgi:ribosomal protein S26
MAPGNINMMPLPEYSMSSMSDSKMSSAQMMPPPPKMIPRPPRMMPPPPQMMAAHPNMNFNSSAYAEKPLFSFKSEQTSCDVPIFGKEAKPKKPKKNAKERFKKQGRKFRHEIDTNVINVKLSCLKEDAELAAGDPVICKKCHAVLNMYSKISGGGKKENKLEEIKEAANEEDDDAEIFQEMGEDDQLWICEFCEHRNVINIEKEEIPTKNAMNYIIDNVEAEADKKHKGESAVIFCIDISGSMCVTKPVEGRFKIKGDKFDELQKLMKFSDGSDQFAFNDRNVTYVSRLQCVQAAIEAQLIDMRAEQSKRKVGLVSFNGDVNIIGDGSQVPQTISGDKLKDYNYLLENGQKVAGTHMQKGIDETESQLNEKLFSMEETGPTALGPAVVSAIAMAGECGNGSTVVICTDGLANIGVGCLEEQKDDTNAEHDVEVFYEQLGDYANQKGVTVNIISIKGEECDLETLSHLYEKTGGNVDIIEPDELKKNFANMLKNETIATRVVTKIKLHKALEFRNEEEKDLNEDKTLLTRDLGNVTDD